MTDRVLPAPARPLSRLLALLGVAAALLLGAGAAPATAQTAVAAAPGAASGGSAEPIEVVVYTGDGCPRCEEQREWLEEVAPQYPGLRVTEYEVWSDRVNRERFVEAGAELGFEASSVPTTVIGERVWIGWTDAIAQDMASALDRVAAGEPLPAGVYGMPGAGTCDDQDLQCATDEGVTVSVPLIGDVSLGGQSLVMATLVIGFVDGINPCSLWVISVLLTIVLRTASRRRVIAVGTTFLLVTAGMYALYMVGIYSALAVVGYLGALQVVVALAAGIFGVVSVKDYFAFKKGVSFTIADSAKPGIYRRMREAAGHHALVPALAATVVLGVVVSLLETPCTAGFPVLWAGLLQANGVGLAEAAGLFVLYMIPFLLDEMIVFGVAVATMRAARLQEKHGQLLKLVAGTTMLALAGAIVVDPAIMEDPMAALLVFAGAFGVAAVVHAVTTRVRSGRDDGPAGRPRPGPQRPVGSAAGPDGQPTVTDATPATGAAGPA